MIEVWFLTAEMEAIQGYVHESVLYNDLVTAAHVESMMVDQDYVLIQVRDEYLPIFIANREPIEYQGMMRTDIQSDK